MMNKLWYKKPWLALWRLATRKAMENIQIYWQMQGFLHAVKHDKGFNEPPGNGE